MGTPSVVRRLRGCVFAHSLCSTFGCPHTGRALARYGGAWSHQRHPLVPYRVAGNNKWPRLLTGSELRAACLNELLADFPALQAVMRDPLWDVLRTLRDEHRHTDTWAQTLRLENGHLLPEQGAFVMRRLCACPDWHNLGYVLALLGSTSMRLAPHRRWLRTRFLTYLILVCMAEPCCFVREPLYELLNDLYVRGFFEAIDDWPSDFATFARACEATNRYGEWMCRCGWISGWDLYACTLLQLYRPDDAVLQRSASVLVGSSVPVELPSRVARKVEQLLEQHRYYQFAIGAPLDIRGSSPP